MNLMEVVLYFIFGIVMGIFINFSSWNGLLNYLFIPSKEKIENWIKSQNWFIISNELRISKDRKCCYIKIFTYIWWYPHHGISNNEINKIKKYLKCKTLEIIRNNDQQIFLKATW